MNKPVAFIRQGADGKPTLVPNPLCQFSYEAECVKQPDIPLYMTPQTNVNPYGWHCFVGEDDCFLINGKNASIPDNSWDRVIPLYTTPQTKPLSDEEINKIKEYVTVELFDEGEYGTEYNIYGIEDVIKEVERIHGIK